MATQAVMRQRVADYLYGAFPTESPFVTRLNASLDSSSTSVTVLDGDQWAANDVVENIETGEQYKVISISGDVLTVIRAWNGTTATAAVGTDDVLYKNPRFTISQIDRALDASMDMLEAWGIHVFGDGSITRADPAMAYELADTDIIPSYGVLEVAYRRSETLTPVAIPFEFFVNLGDLTTSDKPLLKILDWVEVADGADVEYIYAKRIDAVADILGRQEELVTVGAVANLLGATISPATHDPGARTDRTVPPGQTSRDVRYFQGRFFTEARQETAILAVERQRMLKKHPRLARARRWVG